MDDDGGDDDDDDDNDDGDTFHQQNFCLWDTSQFKSQC